MRGPGRRRRGATLAVALLSIVGLAGCETIPPVLTVEQPVFLVGTQLSPSERVPSQFGNGDVITQSSVPMLLQWSATDNNTLCRPSFSGREMWDAHGDDRLFTKATTTELLVRGQDYPGDGPAGRYYGWGIAAHDCSDNDSIERVVPRHVVVVQENGLLAEDVGVSSPFPVMATPTEAWVSTANASFSGGEAQTTVDPDATIGFTYDFGPTAGRPVAVVTSPDAVDSSRAEVLVDGRHVGTIGPVTVGHRAIAWSGAVPAGVHTLTVRKAVDSGAAPLTVDAFVIGGTVWPECGRPVCGD